MKFFLLLCISCASIIVLAQNVGIGVALPQARLHVVSPNSEALRLEASNPYIAFFNNTTYNSYLWSAVSKFELGTVTAIPIVISSGYNDVAYFTNDGRVGINTNAPTERLDVAGNINLRGVLKIDGSAGTNGQVYVTGGPSFNPQWKNLAFANTTRFSASASSSNYTGALTYSSNYNTNTTDVTIGANSITINRTGLYHLDAFLSFGVVYSGTYTQVSPPQVTVSLITGGDVYYGTYLQDLTEKIFYTCCFNKAFNLQTKFSYDLYMVAGQTLVLSRTFSGQPTPATFNNTGVLTGYLISD